MNRTIPLILILSFFSTLGGAQTSLSGKITDSESMSDLIGANIIFNQNGVYKAGTYTDFDGNYSIIVEPGTYDVAVSYVGFPTHVVNQVVVIEQKANLLDVQLTNDEIMSLDEVVVLDYKVPLISTNVCGSGSPVNASQMRNLPVTNVGDFAIKTTRLSSADQDNDVSMISVRTHGVDYYIDGKLVSRNLDSTSKKQSKRRFRIWNIFKKRKAKK